MQFEVWTESNFVLSWTKFVENNVNIYILYIYYEIIFRDKSNFFIMLNIIFYMVDQSCGKWR